jgi:hypothetical protein
MKSQLTTNRATALSASPEAGYFQLLELVSA